MIWRIKMWSTALALVVAALLASWFGGRKSAKTKGLEGYVKTRERMDDVGRLSDADAAAEWLKERANR